MFLFHKTYENEIMAYALKNAIEFGKTDAGKILPKLFQHGLDKKDIGKVMPHVQEVVAKINSMPQKEIKEQFEHYKKYIKEKEEKEKGLPELPNAHGKMVFRMAPYPSGALHLGNAKTYLLNALYAEKYKSKILLVMDDTIGSEEKQVMPESYALLEEAFTWLKVNYDKQIIYKSDRVEMYYTYAEQLIEKDKAYVCSCVQEVLRKHREKGKDCSCRKLPIEEQKNRWKAMFTQPPGSAVLRIKTSMQHPNPAFRDRVLFKIADRPHPRVANKYRVWPTLEMSWAIDDHLLGITHILRGNDLMMETEMEKFIWDIFEWKHPETIHTGLINIEGMGAKLSKSKAQKEVKSGQFSGWDDPRTWSIQSLRRRGFKPEAIRAFVEEIGLNKQDIVVPIDNLYAINRKVIDSTSERYTFAENPVKINIQGATSISEVKVPVHPDRLGDTRTTKVSGVVYISKNDAKTNSNKEIRLLHYCNIKLGKLGKVNKAHLTSVENKNIPRITWVSNPLPTKILMPDGAWIEGVAEDSIGLLKPGAEIQFERFGFVRLDAVGANGYEFWFSHN